MQAIYFCIAFILTAIIGKLVIPVLKKLKVGQNERYDGPRSHLRKQGTPTMGGVIIILTMAILGIAYCIINSSYNILPVILASLGFGLIGLIDDYRKLKYKNTEGLNPKLKMFGLLVISAIYMVYMVRIAGLGTDIIIPFTDITLELPVWLSILFSIVVMLASTNAVNLTDGVDGLCTSVLAIITASFAVIAQKLGNSDASVIAAITSGACAGFLIYNVYKAKVFMGDTGSLFLGGVISSIAIYLKNPLILIIVAIVPVVETLSVILQVMYFRRTGKRLFRMAPLHHHFELSRLERKQGGCCVYSSYNTCVCNWDNGGVESLEIRC